MGKLYKGSFRPLIDRLQRPVTWPPVFSCQPFIETCSREIQTLSIKLKANTERLKNIFYNANEPKQSINTAWQNHRGVKLCKAKGQYIINRKAKLCRDVTSLIYRSFQTISHFPVLPGFLFNTHCRCCDSDCVQLFHLVFHKTRVIMASRARQAIMIVKTAPASPFIRDITRGKSW